jgi:3-oxoacyl-[acyl-carrier-protein] synthase I
MNRENVTATVLKVGVCTALGLNARSSHAAFRAGLLYAEEVELSGIAEPVRAARLTTLAPDAALLGRLGALVDRALQDVGDFALSAQSRVEAFVAVPDADRLADAELETVLRPILSSHLPGLAHSELRWYREGRAGFFFALQAAIVGLAAGACELALVGGFDSLCAPPTLLELALGGRVLGVSSDGTIPGEAAAFALLASPRSARRHESVGEVLCAASGREVHHFGQSEPNTADALTRALREVREHPAARGVRSDLLYTCETGERFWAEEFTLAYFRNTSIMPEPFARTMAAECFGDTGAASGAVLFGVGMLELARPPREDELAGARSLLLCGSSDQGQVGACLLRGRAAVAQRSEGVTP